LSKASYVSVRDEDSFLYFATNPIVLSVSMLKQGLEQFQYRFLCQVLLNIKKMETDKTIGLVAKAFDTWKSNCG
jgi:hypothetical protein